MSKLSPELANCARLLPIVPVERAQPMLRSLVLALLNHRGEPNPATAGLAADEPWRRNLARVEGIGRPPPTDARTNTGTALPDLLAGVAADSGEALDGVFDALSGSRREAVGKALGYLDAGGSAQAFMRRARLYTVERNQGFHDYKFTEAAFRNAAAMPTGWRQRYLAASVLYMNGPGDALDPAVADARVLLADAGIDRL